MTDADILSCVAAIDRRKPEGQPKKTTTEMVVPGKTSEHTAKIIGTNRGKVEMGRTILDHADEETKEAVKSGRQNGRNQNHEKVNLEPHPIPGQGPSE